MTTRRAQNEAKKKGQDALGKRPKRGQEQTILFAWKNEWGNNGKGFIRRRSRMSNRPGRHGGGRPLQRRRDSNDVSTTTFHLGRNHENFYLKSLESIGF